MGQVCIYEVQCNGIWSGPAPSASQLPFIAARSAALNTEIPGLFAGYIGPLFSDPPHGFQRLSLYPWERKRGNIETTDTRIKQVMSRVFRSVG